MCDLFQSPAKLACDRAFLQSSNPKEYVIRLWGFVGCFSEPSSPQVAQADFDGVSPDLFLHCKKTSKNKGAEQPTQT